MTSSNQQTAQHYSLTELNTESIMGRVGKENNSRKVRIIDLTNFEQRRAEITEQLWSAATEVGFFQLANHGLSKEEIQNAFAMSEKFFALPESIKSQYPLKKALNAGWETRAQVRPSTGTADQKESYQITRPHMQGLWPSEHEIANFQQTLLAFEAKTWHIGMQVSSCFADKLGFANDFFTKAHDPSKATYQTTLRLLHYYPLTEKVDTCGFWRAGAHTDFNCLTLLFQRTGQGGLQVCPGNEIASEEWTTVIPQDDIITCNIGDMLMRWSDDKLKSNFHRVRMPLADEYKGSRYTIACFCQANKEAIIQGPEQKYEPISAGDYLLTRMNANFNNKQ